MCRLYTCYSNCNNYTLRNQKSQSVFSASIISIFLHIKPININTYRYMEPTNIFFFPCQPSPCGIPVRTFGTLIPLFCICRRCIQTHSNIQSEKIYLLCDCRVNLYYVDISRLFSVKKEHTHTMTKTTGKRFNEDYNGVHVHHNSWWISLLSSSLSKQQQGALAMTTGMPRTTPYKNWV